MRHRIKKNYRKQSKKLKQLINKEMITQNWKCVFLVDLMLCACSRIEMNFDDNSYKVHIFIDLVC